MLTLPDLCRLRATENFYKARRAFPRIVLDSLIKKQMERFSQDFKDVHMYLKALIEDLTVETPSTQLLIVVNALQAHGTPITLAFKSSDFQIG